MAVRPEEHGVDLFAERTHAPAFHATHFSVKIAFEQGIEVNNLPEMAPAQFCTQCLQNLLIRKHLGEPDHVGQVSLTPPEAILGGQF